MLDFLPPSVAKDGSRRELRHLVIDCLMFVYFARTGNVYDAVVERADDALKNEGKSSHSCLALPGTVTFLRLSSIDT